MGGEKEDATRYGQGKMPEIEAGRDMATLEVKRKVGVFKVKGNGKGKPRDTLFFKT